MMDRTTEISPKSVSKELSTSSPSSTSAPFQFNDNRPEGSIQRKLQSSANVYTSQLANPIQKSTTIQLFANPEQARTAGREFADLSNQEYALNHQITILLQRFQANPSQRSHARMMPLIEEKRLQIKALHAQMLNLVAEYEAADDTPDLQLAYFQEYLGDAHTEDEEGAITQTEVRNIFNSIKAKTEALTETKWLDEGDEGYEEAMIGLDEHESPQVEVPLSNERGRFLLFMMQGLKDDMGAEQYKALNTNLDDRTLKVGKVGVNNLSAGMEDAVRDGQYASKMDDGDVASDAADWNDGGGSGIGFLNSKFAREYDRQANPERDRIQDMQINMDKDDELMPFFTGVQEGQMKLFSPPKKMTVHHEIGHVNSMLEGKSGEGKPMTGKLGKLTDQEEMYNIWGGPRSDRAYGEELGLPQRFDHASLVTYFAPGAHGGGGHGDFTAALDSAKDFTNPVASLVEQLKRLTHSYWGKITSYKFKPGGVKAIKNLLKVTPPDLDAIRTSAANSRDNETDNRHDFTQNFYIEVAKINPAPNADHGPVIKALRAMTVPQSRD
ncbi:MAG: hypothetical protein AAF489_00150 [Bacteroidota bacterium]